MKLPIRNKLIWTAIIVVLLTMTVGPISKKLQLENRAFGHVDTKSTEYVDAGLKRAGAAFLTARAFNATVSVFQESELQLEPGGVGVSLALGQALDPINDLVERFSWVMLVSLTSLGIQKFLIEISPFVSVQIVFLLALLSFLVGLWLPMAARYNFKGLGQILLVSAIMIRFAIPAMAYLNNEVYVVFLEERHDGSVLALEQSVSDLKSHQLNGFSEELETNQDQNVPEEQSPWWKKIPRVFDPSKSMAKLKAKVAAKIEAIESVTLGLVDTIVDLIVVFVLSTIVFPLLFLWGVLKLGQLVIGRGGNLISVNKLGRTVAAENK